MFYLMPCIAMNYSVTVPYLKTCAIHFSAAICGLADYDSVRIITRLDDCT